VTDTPASKHLPIGTATLSNRLQFLDVDARFCELFGCDRESVVGKTLDDLFSPRDRKGAQRFHRRLSGYRGRVIDTQVGLVLGGAEHYARIRLHRLDPEWLGYFENTLLEEDLTYEMSLAEERWRAMFQGSSDGIVILDGEDRIIDHNSRFFELMRFRTRHGVLLSEAAISGRDLWSLLDVHSVPGLAVVIARAREIASPPPAEVITRNERILECRVQPLVLPVKGLVGLCVVVRDLTEQRQLEEMRLREAQAHFAGMAEIATNVLHNLGNICGSLTFSTEELARLVRNSRIDGFLKANTLLADRQARIRTLFADDPKGALLPSYYLKLGEVLQREQQQCRALADDLLAKAQLMKEVIASQQAYAKGTAFSEPVHLAAVVREAIEMHQVALDRHGVQIVTRFEPVPPVRAQKMKLGHVLINLLKNAKEAMADLDRSQKAVTVEVNATSEGGAQIRIIDNGAGIAAEDIPKLFRHGFTTKSSGHGFGLHFSATAMQEMGGTLEAWSDGPGQGATFTLSFPPQLVAAPSSSG